MRAGDTIATARRLLAQQLRERDFDTPELDARLLVAHALALDHAALAAQASRKLGCAEVNAIADLAQRRLLHEPVARIVGHKEFWGLPIRLNAETLVPRPETESLVEAALATLGREGRRKELRVADLGTGSGALLLALLHEWPAAHGVGTDVSLGALTCARANAAAVGYAARASFVACHYGSAIAGNIDLVVCNPPYVARADIATLQPETRDFDPPRALDGGPDGLDGYRAVAADARRLLSPSGVLLVELGFGQMNAVNALFAEAGLAIGPVRYDLSGVARALVLRPVP